MTPSGQDSPRLLASGRFRCESCGRTYSRRDHLVRHLRSHTSQRPFACPECGKGFARADLLLRHSAIHSLGHSGGRLLPGSQHALPRRVSRACKPCAGAKVKCHDEKPCRRCLQRGIQCTPAMAGSVTSGALGEQLANNNQPGAVFPSQVAFTPESDGGKDRVCFGSDSSLPGTRSPISEDRSRALVRDMTDMAWCASDPFGEVHEPNETLSTFQPNINMSPDMEAFLGMPFGDMLLESFRFGGGWEELITSGKIRQASEAFKKSVWYSIPEQMQGSNGFLGHNSPSQSVDEEFEALAREVQLPVPQRFDHRTRDDLFVTLVILAHNHSSECLRSLRTRFPSPALLNLLVHLFLTKQDRKVDSWIHSASFEPNELNTELAAMIVAASALNTSFPALRQLGADLRRLLRPLILNKLENNLQSNYRLQLYQALLLSLQLDLWHDEEDCLHRAGRFSSTIATFLRQELGDGLADPTNAPLADDDTSELAQKWSDWVAAESYRRLMTRFCVYDNQLCMTLGVKAQTTLSEYRLPAPQPRELWLAKTPTEWKRLYLSQNAEYVPRVMDLFASMPTISVIQGFVDRGIAMKVIFHSLGGLITEFQLSTGAAQGLSETHGGWIGHDSTQSRKRDLETAIRSFDHVFHTDICASNIGSFIVSYLSMTLNVPIANLEVLAGKAGEHQSQQMYRIMKDWPETAESREAIWHAGQILRLFKLLERLTSFQIIIAYHAGLVLFAYSVLSCVHGRFPTTPSESALCLNDSSSARLDEFIRNGSAEPMLRSDFRGTERVTVSLLATEEAVEIISEIILNRSCNSEELSPRLVNGLVKLLRDLASAIQIFGDPTS